MIFLFPNNHKQVNRDTIDNTHDIIPKKWEFISVLNNLKIRWCKIINTQQCTLDMRFDITDEQMFTSEYNQSLKIKQSKTQTELVGYSNNKNFACQVYLTICNVRGHNRTLKCKLSL